MERYFEALKYSLSGSTVVVVIAISAMGDVAALSSVHKAPELPPIQPTVSGELLFALAQT